MTSKIKKIAPICIALLPSKLKIIILRMLGAKIGRNCYIGLSIIDAKKIELGNCVRIGHLNIIHRLTEITLSDGSKIESMNWITGGGKGKLLLGRNSSIRRLHFLEASGNITIGSNTVIAGRNTLFFTHGLSPDNLNVIKPITIGDWCYVGAACRFLPGAQISNNSFVGMGSVVVKPQTQEYVLIAGNPGTPLKQLPKDSKYFARKFLKHIHHPKDWNG